MKKTNKTKTIISLIVIVALAILIVNINKVVPSSSSNTVGVQAKQEVSGKELTGGVVTEYGKCFSEYGESPETVVFVHSNSCPHCNNMKPIIKELEDEGYGFYWAESSDIQAVNMVSSCFGDLISRYVPQFICPKTGVEQTGAMTKAQLKEFSDGCI